jgi:hypothetical protein
MLLLNAVRRRCSHPFPKKNFRSNRLKLLFVNYAKVSERKEQYPKETFYKEEEESNYANIF